MSDESATPATETYVRTEHTAGWAKLSSGGQLVADAQKLIAARRQRQASACEAAAARIFADAAEAFRK